jgi:hypothetical protein
VGASPLQQGILHDQFTFVINGKLFPTSALEAMVRSPVIWEQLQVDACARQLVICDPEIESADFSSLQGLLSGMESLLQALHQKSLILLSRQLWIIGLVRLFFSLWNDSAVDTTVTLSSAFAAASRVYIQSVSAVSLLSVDTLDGLLSSESFLVDSEDALLQILFTLGYPSLLRHIRREFMGAAAIASV